MCNAYSDAIHTDHPSTALPTLARITPLARLLLLPTHLDAQFPRSEQFRGEDEGGESFVYEGTRECLGAIQ